jgi:phosphatidylserine synthase
LGYLFDCYDGNFARTYNMESEFGDKFDHFTDIFTIIALLYLVLSDKNISKETKITFMIINTILAIITFYNLGCQDSYCEENTGCETSNFFIKSCDNVNDLRYTRYFGCGSLALFNTIVIALTKYL